jgi:threonine aldolase
MKPIDLRSDTVTKPSAGMRQALAQADVGEELYREDPTVNELQQRSAEVLGHEACLFVPTGTMGNLIALRAHTMPGDEVIFESRAHIYNNEMGGFAAICGLIARPVPGDADGMISWDLVRQSMRPPHRGRTQLVCMENTHAFTGGRVLPQSDVNKLCDNLRTLGVASHLDGARLGNASHASGTGLAELASPFGSVMFDFSKGLGSPAGAVVAGSKAFIDRARRVRKLVGGEIHQPGILAGACLYGLLHHLPKLQDDHQRARRLAEGLKQIAGIVIDTDRVITNIVLFRLEPHLDVSCFLAELRKRQVLAGTLEDGSLRFVIHLDIDDSDVNVALRAVEGALNVVRAIRPASK